MWRKCEANLGWEPDPAACSQTSRVVERRLSEYRIGAFCERNEHHARCLADFFAVHPGIHEQRGGAGERGPRRRDHPGSGFIPDVAPCGLPVPELGRSGARCLASSLALGSRDHVGYCCHVERCHHWHCRHLLHDRWPSRRLRARDLEWKCAAAGRTGPTTSLEFWLAPPHIHPPCAVGSQAIDGIVTHPEAS